jgi:DNA-binding CsgD family transcriptional regulator
MIAVLETFPERWSMRVASHDVDRVLRILPPLYTYAPLNEFLTTSIHLLHGLMQCDHSAWFVYEYRDRVRLRAIAESDRRVTRDVAAILEEGVTSHPLARHCAIERPAGAVLLSDTPERARMEHRERYAEIYRLLEMDHEITLPIVLSSERSVGISFRKRARDFTERDRHLLNLLQPHVQRAFANAELVDARGDSRPVQSALADTSVLTDREAEVAFWIAEGKTNSEIGLILGMATRTVEKHVEHLLEKLRVENRTTAAIQLRTLLRALPENAAE